jgi:hypothetical protein
LEKTWAQKYFNFLYTIKNNTSYENNAGSTNKKKSFKRIRSVFSSSISSNNRFYKNISLLNIYFGKSFCGYVIKIINYLINGVAGTLQYLSFTTEEFATGGISIFTVVIFIIF